MKPFFATMIFSNAYVLVMLLITIAVIALIGYTAYSLLKKQSKAVERHYLEAKQQLHQVLDFMRREWVREYVLARYDEPNEALARELIAKIERDFGEYQMQLFTAYLRAYEARRKSFRILIQDRLTKGDKQQRKALYVE